MTTKFLKFPCKLKIETLPQQKQQAIKGQQDGEAKNDTDQGDSKNNSNPQTLESSKIPTKNSSSSSYSSEKHRIHGPGRFTYMTG